MCGQYTCRVSKKKLTPLLFKLAAKVSVFFTDPVCGDAMDAFMSFGTHVATCMTNNFSYYTGCLKNNAMEIQQAVVHHKRG
jgi:hypothetical protein